MAAVGLWGRIAVVEVISLGMATAWSGTAIVEETTSRLSNPAISSCLLLPANADIENEQARVHFREKSI